jgi:hypothetical protein
MAVLSGTAPWDFNRIRGTHRVRGRILYEDEGQEKYSQAETWYTNVSLSDSGVFNFEILSQPPKAP